MARVAKLCEKSKVKFQVDRSYLEFKLGETTKYALCLNDLNFQGALEEIWQRYRQLDRYLEQQKPWEIKEKATLRPVLEHAVSEILKTNKLLEPFLPETAGKIKQQFIQKYITSSAALFPRK